MWELKNATKLPPPEFRLRQFHLWNKNLAALTNFIARISFYRCAILRTRNTYYTRNCVEDEYDFFTLHVA